MAAAAASGTPPRSGRVMRSSRVCSTVVIEPWPSSVWWRWMSSRATSRRTKWTVARRSVRLQGAAVALGGGDGDVEGARNRAVDAGGADAHEGAVGDMATGPGDGQGHRFQWWPPVAADAVVGHDGEQARCESMQRPRPLQSRELGARVAVDVRGVDRAQDTAPTYELRRNSCCDTHGRHCHLRSLEPYVCASHDARRGRVKRTAARARLPSNDQTERTTTRTVRLGRAPSCRRSPRRPPACAGPRRRTGRTGGSAGWPGPAPGCARSSRRSGRR